MNTLSFIDHVQAFRKSISDSIKRHNLIVTDGIQLLFHLLDTAIEDWEHDESGRLHNVYSLYDCMLVCREVLEGEKKKIKRTFYYGDLAKAKLAVKAETNVFQGARGNRFVEGLKLVMEELLSYEIECKLEASLSPKPEYFEMIWDAYALLEERGLTDNPLVVRDLLDLLITFEKSIPSMKEVAPRFVDDFLEQFTDHDDKELLRIVRDKHENFSLYDQIGDFMSWVEAIGWLAGDLLSVGFYARCAIKLLDAIILADKTEPLINELVQYTDHSTDALEEWLQDERSLDNDETDLIPLLEEYFYHVEGVYPDHMSYAVDAVDQGICPNVFEAEAWIDNGIIGKFESTTDYAQQVLDEMDNPNNLPLIKPEDFWEKELRYDISVLEDESIKLLLVRA